MAAAGSPAPDKAFVIGGAQLYELALRFGAAAIHMTRIDADFDGDTFLAEPDPARWRERSREHFAPAGARPFAMDIVVYEAVAPGAAAARAASPSPGESHA